MNCINYNKGWSRIIGVMSDYDNRSKEEHHMVQTMAIRRGIFNNPVWTTISDGYERRVQTRLGRMPRV